MRLDPDVQLVLIVIGVIAATITIWGVIAATITIWGWLRGRLR